MSFALGFWGLQVGVDKQYSQEVDASFRVSMASFGKKVTGSERTSVIAVVDGKEYVLCNLIPNKIEQQPLDIIFSTGENISFHITGKNEVHLTGNYVPDDEEHGDDCCDSDEDEEDFDEEIDSDEYGSDGELDSEEEAKLLKLIAQEDDEDIELSEEEDEEEEEEEEEKVVVTKKQPESVKQKRKAEEVPAETQKEKKNKNKKEKEAKKETAVKKEEPKNKKANTNRKELPNGLIIEDIEAGQGQKATKGKRLSMRYIGRLMNGKVFDQNTKGKPFNFKLGKGEVIKGWDLGIEGMLVNGKRRLTIPAKLAYGPRGAPPDIPPNATLQFDIQLVGTN